MSEIIPPGIYYNMEDSEYRSDPGISQSELKPIMRSAAHFKAGVDDEEGREDTDALILGRMVGQIAMEPNKKPWWAVRPDGVDLRTKAGKEWLATIGQSVPVSQDTFRKACIMATTLLDHPIAGQIISTAQREVTVIDECSVAGEKIRRKCRIDLVGSGNVLADIKTTLDAREKPFRKSVVKYGYHIQAYSYLELWNSRCEPSQRKDHFLFIAIEKAPPYAIIVHHITPEFVAIGAELYLSAINLYAKCKSENKWPGYSEAIQELEPGYGYSSN